MKFKKSHVPVILASILLVILVGTLVYVIFFMKESTKTNLFAKKISDYKVEIKVATYDDNSEPVDYEHMDYKEAKVTNYVNNALVDNEILSSDIEVLPISDGFIVYSTSNELIEKCIADIKEYLLGIYRRSAVAVCAVYRHYLDFFTVLDGFESLYILSVLIYRFNYSFYDSYRLKMVNIIACAGNICPDKNKLCIVDIVAIEGLNVKAAALLDRIL